MQWDRRLRRGPTGPTMNLLVIVADFDLIATQCSAVLARTIAGWYRYIDLAY
jgi:hypothetical protein